MQLKHFYTAQPLAPGQRLKLGADLAHRLHRVLRLPDGAVLGLFNGQLHADGQYRLFQATLDNSRQGLVLVGDVALQKPAQPQLQLALCLPKKDALDAALRQATELGVTAIIPLLSKHAVADKLNTARAQQRLTEAAEQCERLSVPHLHPAQPLAQWLAQLQAPVAWAHERSHVAAGMPPHAATLLVGPEGGFSADEIAQLQQHPAVHPCTLGATILRTDTAVVCGLSLLRRQH